jgi:hypothetical protein
MIDRLLEYSEGAALIIEYCEDQADQLNLDLRKTPYWVSPISAASKDMYDLIIDSKLGSLKIVFTRKQIEDYPAHNKSAVENRVLSAFNSI